MEVPNYDERILLIMTIDTAVCSISEYIEISLSRMLLCHKAAERLVRWLSLTINGQVVM